ncbi:MAG: hypothetical protein QOJ63_3840, partial [Solirubrobacteraceae bacterium]|nr:hypothetical protein [Solirubrobacteraceae bacterium]
TGAPAEAGNDRLPVVALPERAGRPLPSAS